MTYCWPSRRGALRGGDGPSKNPTRKIPGNCPEFQPEPNQEIEKQRRPVFSSDREARRVSTVVTQGTQELVEAMESADLSIGAAAVIVQEPPAVQARVLSLEEGKRKREVKRLRRELRRSPIAGLDHPEAWRRRGHALGFTGLAPLNYVFPSLRRLGDGSALRTGTS
jgi:hypothetical protein